MRARARRASRPAACGRTYPARIARSLLLPGGGGVRRGRLAALKGARLVERTRSCSQRLDTLERRLAMRSGCRPAVVSRDAVTRAHGLQAEVPAHRVGDLLHDPSYGCRWALVDHLAVGVWQISAVRGSCVDSCVHHLHCGAMCSVRKAPATHKPPARAPFSGGLSARACRLGGAGGDHPAGAVDVLAGVRPCSSRTVDPPRRRRRAQPSCRWGWPSQRPAVDWLRSRPAPIACSAVIARAPAAAVSLLTPWLGHARRNASDPPHAEAARSCVVHVSVLASVTVVVRNRPPRRERRLRAPGPPARGEEWGVWSLVQGRR